MFKRVEKKLAKKKKEEELGITEEVKEAIGLNDVDSDDSTSDESEASSSSSTPKVPSKRKRSLEDGSDEGYDAVSEENDAEDDDGEPGVQMTVEETLHNPLYIVSIQPDIRGCIVCPHKTLKNGTMASVHTTSQVCRSRCNPWVYCEFSWRGRDICPPPFGRRTSGEYPNSGKRPHPPNQMMMLGRFWRLLSH